MEEFNPSTDVLPTAAPAGIADPPLAPAAEPAVEIELAAGMRRYGTLVIAHIRFEGESQEALVRDIKQLIATCGGAVSAVEVIGRRTLAYKIRKQTEGVYLNFVYAAPPSAVALIERDLRHMEALLRFLTTVEG